jgi:alginate O-acetyltransferase complex protein AlgI
MLFCTLPFLYFLVPVLTLYWLMPWKTARVLLLLVASYYFYACWDSWLALLVAGSSCADYLIGRGLDAFRGPRARMALLLLSVCGNLGLLAYFKYVNFFLASLETALRSAGLEAQLPVLSVLAPIGISFYTFEALSYTIDVYLRRIPAERNLFHFMLFILFFPHLVAGPIVRGRDFLPQIRRRKRWNWQRFQVGLEYIVLGVIKKMAISDRMAGYSDPVFADPSSFSTTACWVAVVAYSLQIYCDFSGYTDIAIGVAHWFGYRLTKNFDMPYISANVSEFWRRWHISLSSWLRDYLFIPLGGSRGSRWLTYRNFLIVMLLGGLWHGAAWTFVVWGALHGAYLIVHHAFRDFCQRLPRLNAWLERWPARVGSWLLTLLVVMVAWVFFRATTFAIAADILGRMFVPTRGMRVDLPLAPFWILLGVVVLGHLAGVLQLRKRLAEWTPSYATGAAYASGVVLALLFAADASQAFIYFQF